jgi:hypothetical protein
MCSPVLQTWLSFSVLTYYDSRVLYVCHCVDNRNRRIVRTMQVPRRVKQVSNATAKAISKPSSQITSRKDRTLGSLPTDNSWHLKKHECPIHSSMIFDDLDAARVESGVRSEGVSSGCRCQVHLSNLQAIATSCTTPSPHFHAGTRSVPSVPGSPMCLVPGWFNVLVFEKFVFL